MAVERNGNSSPPVMDAGKRKDLPAGVMRPQAGGLYDPLREHDACGVGFIVNLKNIPSQQTVQNGLKILENLEHRGAVGADPLMGDGAGIMVQIPHKFFLKESARLGFRLPEKGDYAVGFIFMPQDAELRLKMERVANKVIEDEGATVIGWRDVPSDNSSLSKDPEIVATEPFHRQVIIGKGEGIEDEEAFERKLYIIRKVMSAKIYSAFEGKPNDFYIVSMSCRTLVYKGMFLSWQLAAYFADLHDPDFESALALVHQRFSTNTFPSWRLAHPYRFVCHNGEINTVRGNVNWMAARQASVSSPLFGADINKLWPISYPGQSDTACFDNALEFLLRGGYSLPHAAMMLIPEAWAGNPLMDEERRAFYEYHAALMEPWDGPAAMCFSDGIHIGATLDRNGLRPARYFVTEDDEVIMSSEAGVLPVPAEKIKTKWRLQPGKMLLIDLRQGRIVSDEEIKHELASANPYKQWLGRTQIVLEDLPAVHFEPKTSDVPLLDRQQAFGYTQEDLKMILPPMAVTGQEAVGSMGTDTPISALSSKSKLLYTYFKQNFAQVTNPPIDSIREELVMSLVSFIGPRPNVLDLTGGSRRQRLEVRQPILSNEDLEKVRAIGGMEDNPFRAKTLDITYPVSEGADGMEKALEQLFSDAELAVHSGDNIIILSDRAMSRDRVAIPGLLATAGVHHHLIRKGLRTSVGLVVETGEAREVHHFCALAGYGAEAINPYLAFETLAAMRDQFPPEVDEHEV
ncbi:MAG: glutamate synthase central domain-containing protein, partial [Devosia sp.]